MTSLSLKVPLQEVCTLQSGFAFKSSDWRSEGTPVVRIGNVRDGYFEWSGVACVDPETAVSASAFATQAGDILVGMTGYVGSVAKIRKNEAGSLVNQRVGIVRDIDTERLDSDYLYWFLRSSEAKSDLVNRAFGSAQANLSAKEFGKVAIPLPPLDEQRRIAGVLGALDDLIEVNRGLIRDMRELRQLQTMTLLNRAQQQSPLSDFARFVNGRNFTKDASNTGRPVIRTPELRVGPSANTVWNDVEVDRDYVANFGDILFVWSGSLLVDRWTYREGLVNQHIFKVVPEPEVPDWLVMGLIELKMPWFLGLAADKATTMGHIQRSHLDVLVPSPDKSAIEEVLPVVEPLWNGELQLWAEIHELQAARDELLPLLLSGRVRVGDVAA